MDLSNDLISKFVKITNDGDKKKTKEGTVYGTAVKYDGNMYVKIDGSDLLTPIDTTADIKEGERVTIMIKDHNATVTGNVTSPSASSADVKKVTKNVEEIEGEITEFEAIIADVVHVGELDAEVARIDELIAGKASVEDLTATNAEITKLKAKDAEIENLVAEKATVEDLTATNAEITNLKAKDAEIENLVADKATIENLTATNARIDSLQANKADITYLDANFATIDELEATNADIEVLDAEVADINTLVNGNLTSDNILSLNITSQNTTMENAFVKDAMIDTVTANKIMSGTIDTNNVTIQSTDGSMLLQGTLLQMKDDNGKVRIQIGKDTGGNFTFVLYDESGTGVLIDEEGIKSSDAIADGLIVDAKVADNANIAGSKLDIASVITEVNNDNSTTIKSNKIYLDEQGQSLEVAFNSLKTHVDTIQDVTIDGDLTEVIEQVQSNTTKIEANKEGINTLVAENVIRTEEISDLEGELQQVNTTLSNKYASLEQNLDGFKTTVSDTYTTKTEFQNLEVGSTNLVAGTKDFSSGWWYDSAYMSKANDTAIDSRFTGISISFVPSTAGKDYCDLTKNKSVWVEPDTEYTLSFWARGSGKFYTYLYGLSDGTVASHYNSSGYSGTQSDGSSIHTLSSNDTYKRYWVVYRTKSTAQGTVNLIVARPAKNLNTDVNMIIYGVKFEKGNKPTDWSPAPEDVQANIDAVDGKFANYSTTTQMNSAIQQKANEITSSVSQTYATKQSVTDVNNNLANNYSTTTQMNSAIQQKANEITSSVSQTYSTKSEFNNLQIGGTNLLPHSGNFKDNCGLWITNGSSITLETVITYNGHNTIKIHNDSSNGIMYSEYISLKPNTTYTYSITAVAAVAAGVVTGDNIRPLHMWVHPQGDGSNVHREEILDSSHAGIGTRWGRSYIVFKTPDTDDVYLMKPFIHQTEGQIIYIANFKVEEGNRPTDWSPAPEDVQGQIDATNNNLANNYSTTSAMISAIQQKANEITSSVSQTYTTKSEFNNLQIGGKNLLLNSKRETTNNEYCIVSFRPTELFEVGEKYTVSICVTPANGVTHIHPYTSMGWSPLSIPLYVNGTTRQVLSITFTFNGYNSDKVPVDIYDNNAFVQFYRFPNDETVTGNTTLHWAKVEKGAKATDWTPAPEDVQTQIDTINTNLTTYATKSELTQTNNSIVAKFSESGGYNLIRNSTGAGVSTNGWIHTATSMGVEANDRIGSANRYYLYLDNGTTTIERYAYSSRFKLKPNTTYRFTGYFLNYTKCPSFDVFVLSSTSLPDTDTTTGYTNVHNLIQSASTRGVWKKYTTTFTTPASTKSGILRIDNNGYDQSGTNSNRVHWNCLILTEGEMEVPWSPHPSEIYDGITKIDKNGLQVSQSNYNGYTQMKADGFYVNNGSENVISITKDGSYFKGKVVITSGSTVPTSVLSGTISSSQLNSSITSDISTAKSNASTAVSTANTASTNASNAVKTANTASTNASTAVSTANTANTNASNAVSTANTANTNASNAVKTANTASTNASTAVSTANTAKSTADTANSTANSVKSTVDSGKTNWNNAYNRVNEWAYGAVTGSTTIDGGYIQADTITAKHMAIGDFNNYSQLVKGKSLTNRYGTATWTEGTGNHSYWVTTNLYFPFTVNETLNPFKAGDRVQIKFDAYTPSTRNVRVGIWFYSGTAADTNIGINTADVSCSATWDTKTVNLTLPSGNTYVQSAKSIAILIANGTSGERIEVRNVTIRRLVAGDLIVDGAITAAKIASGAITADKLAANAITSKTITGSTITGGTISGATITSETLMKTYGGMYVGSEIWGGFAKNSSGTYESINQFNIKASKNLFLQGNNVYIYPSTGEVKIGDTSSYDNLRARCLYAQEIVYTDDIRARTTGAALTMENISMRAANAYVQFTSGLGIVRVKERNHLYLQTGGNTGGDTSAEIRCTRYTDASNYVNIRAHNVCAQNAVYAAGVNVSSDRARKRDIELYSTDALQEVCSTPVYAYHLDTDKDEELKRIGIIMQEAPLDAIDLTGKGVDLYQMVTMLWRAVQQQQEIINELKGE